MVTSKIMNLSFANLDRIHVTFILLKIINIISPYLKSPFVKAPHLNLGIGIGIGIGTDTTNAIICTSIWPMDTKPSKVVI